MHEVMDVEVLIRRFMVRGGNLAEQETRGRLGTLGSLTGIVVNVLLAVIKFAIGTLTGSVAVTADAANNLSDAGGSIVSLVSIRMAQKPIDREHPFGHGRMEYIGALGVGVLILLMGAELLRGGVESILHPEPLSFGWAAFAALVVSIGLKGLLYLFYDRLGWMIDSSALRAAAKDSVSDVLATSAVAVSMLVGHFFGVPIDGWMGVLVALLVLKAGFEVCRDTVDSLLGGKPDQELGKQIIELLTSYDQILGAHDLMIHDYGPGRCVASVHAEVSADEGILEIHEVIDRAEQEIGQKLNIPICIHMDPIVTGDPETDRVQEALRQCLRDSGEEAHLHDLRRVPGVERINLVFDVAVPAGYKDTQLLTARLEACAREIDVRYQCVIHYDIDYYHQ